MGVTRASSEAYFQRTGFIYCQGRLGTGKINELLLKDMGTIKTFQFQPIGQGYENLGLLMPYVFREPNELCEIRDDGGLRQVGRVHLKKDGSLVVSGVGEFNGRYSPSVDK